MNAGFRQIERIEEESDGLSLKFKGAPAGRLRRDHPGFEGLRELLEHLLQEKQTQGLPRLTWVALDDSGVITEVRQVLKGIPLGTDCDSSGGYWIVFPFTNESRHLIASHPRFREMEHQLLSAIRNETPLHFVGSTGNFYAIDDLLPDE